MIEVEIRRAEEVKVSDEAKEGKLLILDLLLCPTSASCKVMQCEQQQGMNIQGGKVMH